MLSVIKKFMVLFLILCFSLCGAVSVFAEENGKVRIGVSWGNAADESRKACIEAIKAAGAEPVFLDEAAFYLPGKKHDNIKQSDGSLSRKSVRLLLKNIEDSNAESVMSGIDAVVFCGKDALSPTLFDCAVKDKYGYSARTDASDVLLMGWCLANNVPVLGIGRGMELIGALYDAELIENIEEYYGKFKLNGQGIHQNDIQSAAHEVEIKGMNNNLYEIANGAYLPNVPSDHNRALVLKRNSKLKVTGISIINGVELIEAIEVPGKSFAVGIAFNPELAIEKALKNLDTQNKFLPYNRAIRFFTYLKNEGLKRRIRLEEEKARQLEQDMEENTDGDGDREKISGKEGTLDTKGQGNNGKTGISAAKG